ncbi:MAG: hypothetical protein WKF88_11885 [Ferruginibacter sp.]
MKKIFILIAGASLFLNSCKKEQTELTAPAAVINSTTPSPVSGRVANPEVCEKIVTLYAGQTINAGEVTVTRDADFIYVTYTTANGWLLTQTHLFVGECGSIPVTGSGNPRPGQFPYKTTHNKITSFTYTVPVSKLGADGCGCIAAHAVVVKLNAAGQVIQTETGWGDGPRINPTGNWATRFDYCICN